MADPLDSVVSSVLESTGLPDTPEVRAKILARVQQKVAQRKQQKSQPMQRSVSKQNAARGQQEIDDESNRSWMDRGASFLMGNRDGLLGSLSDEVGSTVDYVKENPASLAAMLSPIGLPYLMTGSNIGEGAEQRRANNVSMSEDAQQSDPGLYGGGQLLGTGLQAAVTAPVTAGKGALNAAKAGGGIGGVMGAAEGEGSDRAGNALLGAGIGTVLGAAGSKIGDDLIAPLARRVSVKLKPKQSLGPFEAYLNDVGHPIPSGGSAKPAATAAMPEYNPETFGGKFEAEGLDNMMPLAQDVGPVVPQPSGLTTVKPKFDMPEVPEGTGTHTFMPEDTVTGPALQNEPQMIGGFGKDANTPDARNFADWVKTMDDPIPFTPGKEVTALPPRHSRWAEATDLDNMAPETLDELFPRIGPDAADVRTTPNMQKQTRVLPEEPLAPPSPVPEPAPQPLDAPQNDVANAPPSGVDSVPSNWPPPEPSTERWLELMKMFTSDLPPVPPVTPRNPSPPSADYIPSKGKNKAKQAKARERKDQGTYKKPPKKPKKNPWAD